MFYITKEKPLKKEDLKTLSLLNIFDKDHIYFKLAEVHILNYMVHLIEQKQGDFYNINNYPINLELTKSIQRLIDKGYLVKKNAFYYLSDKAKRKNIENNEIEEEVYTQFVLTPYTIIFDKIRNTIKERTNEGDYININEDIHKLALIERELKKDKSLQIHLSVILFNFLNS